MPSWPRKSPRPHVNRIALADDRIAKVVRAPDGFAVEHDAVSGDLYLRPAHPSPSGGTSGHEPVTLFVGTERGFTYRLTLTPVRRDSAQILIRNARGPGGRGGARRGPRGRRLRGGAGTAGARRRPARAAARLRDPSRPPARPACRADAHRDLAGSAPSRRSCSRPRVRHRAVRRERGGPRRDHRRACGRRAGRGRRPSRRALAGGARHRAGGRASRAWR